MKSQLSRLTPHDPDNIYEESLAINTIQNIYHNIFFSGRKISIK